MIPCIAIFDIGKTNKKLMLFDLKLNLVHEEQTNFEEVKDDEGDNCEDLRALTNWMLQMWAKIENDIRFDVKALNFTTYGASFVHLDENLRPVTPLYNYLKPLPKEVEDKFFAQYGPKDDFATKTASPALGMLNSGLQIYWLKEKHPLTYSKIKYSLHFPQFCSFLFTKNMGAEFTSIGCHTGMWDMTINDYHEYIYKENIHSKLPEIKREHLNGHIKFRQNQIPVGTGLHDSSAALIPYLMQIEGEFLLLSTGTWCITLNPFAKNNLTKEELNQDCLNYMTFKGQKVKASRLFLGNFHENYTKRFSGHFFKDKNYFKTIKLDLQLIEKVKSLPRLLKDKVNPDQFFKPTDLDIFSSYEEAYHKLLIDMVDYQVEAVNLAAEQSNKITKLFVDGGFNKNDLFMKLLQERLPTLKIEAFEISQGTAMGGAMVMSNLVS